MTPASNLWTTLRRPWQHKGAVFLSLVFVAILTGLSYGTIDTRDRQTTVEQKFDVQRTSVVRAFCRGEITKACRMNALNIIEGCIQTPRCAALLALLKDGKIAEAEVLSQVPATTGLPPPGAVPAPPVAGGPTGHVGPGGEEPGPPADNGAGETTPTPTKPPSEPPAAPPPPTPQNEPATVAQGIQTVQQGLGTTVGGTIQTVCGATAALHVCPSPRR